MSIPDTTTRYVLWHPASKQFLGLNYYEFVSQPIHATQWTDPVSLSIWQQESKDTMIVECIILDVTTTFNHYQP